MKRVFSMLFAALVLFNTLGYYGLFWGLEYRHTRVMLEKIDDESYDASATMTIKVPLALPYGTDTRGFVRVDGVLEHQGQVYRMVKQQLLRDTLHIVVLKDVESNRLQEAKAHLAKSFADRPADTQTAKTLSNLIKDYLLQSFATRPLTSGWVQELTANTFVPSTPVDFHPSINHPPELG